MSQWTVSKIYSIKSSDLWFLKMLSARRHLKQERLPFSHIGFQTNTYPELSETSWFWECVGEYWAILDCVMMALRRRSCILRKYTEWNKNAEVRDSEGARHDWWSAGGKMTLGVHRECEAKKGCRPRQVTLQLKIGWLDGRKELQCEFHGSWKSLARVKTSWKVTVCLFV